MHTCILTNLYAMKLDCIYIFYVHPLYFYSLFVLIQTGLLVAVLCPGAEDVAECEAAIPMYWPGIGNHLKFQ